MLYNPWVSMGKNSPSRFSGWAPIQYDSSYASTELIQSQPFVMSAYATEHAFLRSRTLDQPLRSYYASLESRIGYRLLLGESGITIRTHIVSMEHCARWKTTQGPEHCFLQSSSQAPPPRAEPAIPSSSQSQPFHHLLKSSLFVEIKSPWLQRGRIALRFCQEIALAPKEHSK
jgi:hypothetical protein